ncbi:hypothetical protein ABZ078_15190 [Streptomyces sp. NPDC006385]|uniref:hypothetical protein n=1 Tax=Streptomyces sp. NPDC006385 TaxID=3156761 RepID=UPI0033A7DC42
MTRSLALALAGAAGLGAFAATSGTAFADLRNRDGSVIPIHVQGGSLSLPAQTNSIRVTVPGVGSDCKVVTDRNRETDTGFRLSEGRQFELAAYNDRACQGTRVGGVGYTASYSGPDPRNGMFTRVLVRIQNPALFACTSGGWTDGRAVACRQS